METRIEPQSADDKNKRAAGDSGAGRRNRWVQWVVVLGLLGGGWWAWTRFGSELGHTAPAPAPAARAASVSVATTWVGDLPLYLTGLGNVIPLESVVVRTRIDGELIKVAFIEGQNVMEKDLLAQIDARPFEIQKALAEAQEAKDASLLANAKLDLKRYEVAGKSVARQLLDTAAATVTQYEAALKMDAAQIDAARLQITYCSITSPLTGRVGLRLVDQGNIVHTSDPGGIAVVTKNDPIAIQFSLPQDDLPRVVEAQTKGAVAADAFDRALTRHLASGTLTAIDTQIDPASGTVRMKATFPNGSGALFPNQFVNVRLLVETRRKAVLMPVAGAQRNARAATFVYVVDPQSRAEIRSITLGPATGDTVVVTEGLSAEEVVVTDGVDKLQAGAQVVVRNPESRRSEPSSTRETSASRSSNGR
jgi:multidrug efflux system membrane fusion protein